MHTQSGIELHDFSTSSFQCSCGYLKDKLQCYRILAASRRIPTAILDPAVLAFLHRDAEGVTDVIVVKVSSPSMMLGSIVSSS